MKHSELVEIAYKWLLKFGSVGVAFKELKSMDREIPDVIGFGAWSSKVIEVKVSRSDFIKDKSKSHRVDGRGMGTYRYYCCPTGLISVEELPEKWGLIYVSENGKATCIYDPEKDRGRYDTTLRRWSKCNKFLRDIEAEQRVMYCALRKLQLKGKVECIYERRG